jgi:hypothetical protein
MASGFNTDVRVGDRVFHVQTEDRGPSRPVIDTMVYRNGRVLFRRSFNYTHFAESSEFTHEGLRERVEEQHRAVIEDLRTGTLESDSSAADASQSGVSQTEPGSAQEAPQAAGIALQLLNPDSWLTAGSVSLNVEILRRADQKPERGAVVEALIEGSLQERRHTGTTDDKGRVHIRFPMPQLGKGGLALVILAKGQAGNDELRLVMRSSPGSRPCA